MIFTKNKNFSKCEINLVKNFLEELIGTPKNCCLETARKNGFIFLDKWNNKMGFVKEIDKTQLILSLHFHESICQFYQVIVKESGKNWGESRMIDYNNVRETGIVS